MHTTVNPTARPRPTARTVRVSLGVVAIGIAAAYGITALPADLAPTPADEDAATAIEYGLISALTPQRDGVHIAAID
jgi:hypothetical protein